MVGLGAILVAVTVAGDLTALERIPRERFALLPSGEPLLSHFERWSIPVIGSLVAQEVIVRALAARSPEIARRGTVAGGVLFIAVGTVPILLGLIGATLLPGLAEPDSVLIVQAQRYLPTALYVVFAGALVSAILSTVDSTLLVAGSLAAHNGVLSFRPRLSPRAKLLANRAAVVTFGFVAWGLARSAESVFELVQESSAFGTAGIVVVFLFSFARGWGGKWAAAAALAAGALVYQVGSREFLEYPYLAALAAALAAFLAGGLLDRRGRAGAVRGGGREATTL